MLCIAGLTIPHLRQGHAMFHVTGLERSGHASWQGKRCSMIKTLQQLLDSNQTAGNSVDRDRTHSHVACVARNSANALRQFRRSEAPCTGQSTTR